MGEIQKKKQQQKGREMNTSKSIGAEMFVLIFRTSR